MSITDRVAYIRGMVEGMTLDANTPEGKLLLQIIEALGDTAVHINELEAGYEDLCEYVESIDEDLETLEMEFHGENEEEFNDEEEEDDFDGMLLDDFDDDDDEDDSFEAEDEIFEDDFDDDEYDSLICCTCPECKQLFGVDSDDEEDEDDDSDLSIHNQYVCPHCEKTVTPIPLDFSKLAIAPMAETDTEDE